MLLPCDRMGRSHQALEFAQCNRCSRGMDQPKYRLRSHSVVTRRTCSSPATTAKAKNHSSLLCFLLLVRYLILERDRNAEGAIVSLPEDLQGIIIYLFTSRLLMVYRLLKVEYGLSQLSSAYVSSNHYLLLYMTIQPLYSMLTGVQQYSRSSHLAYLAG